MKVYLNGPDAVKNLHNKGFTDDFHLVGNDLLWVQEKCLIRVGAFDILEYHKIKGKNNSPELVVFGINAPHHNVKGILLRHAIHIKVPVLVKKLNEMHAVQGTNLNP